MIEIKACYNCESDVKKLRKLRTVYLCEDCMTIAEVSEKSMRGRMNDEFDNRPIDLQREMSEGCLDDYMY